MIGKRMQDAMNEQIKHELESAYLYLSMVAYLNAEGLDGMAAWMTVQTKEEIANAMRFFSHINERSGRVELLPLAQPKKEWASPLEAFKAAYAHEQFISGNPNFGQPDTKGVSKLTIHARFVTHLVNCALHSTE